MKRNGTVIWIIMGAASFAMVVRAQSGSGAFRTTDIDVSHIFNTQYTYIGVSTITKWCR